MIFQHTKSIWYPIKRILQKCEISVLLLVFMALSSSSTISVPEKSDHVVFQHLEPNILNGKENQEARLLAAHYGLHYVSEVFPGSNYHHAILKNGTTQMLEHQLSKDPRIGWVQMQYYYPRSLRFIPSRHSDVKMLPNIKTLLPNNVGIMPRFNDPLYPLQWYLHGGTMGGGEQHHLHLNVLPVWEQGLSGRGVSVAILDDNVNPLNLDISHNYDAEISVDLGATQHSGPDIKPNPIHGTYCAAVVAAEANNSYCGVGVAFKARIGGVRLLVKKRVLDVLEAKALNHKLDRVHIYSASWGPPDDGKHIGGPGILASRALERGISLGRQGLGAIYIWASGNGGLKGDHCGYDSYASSPYTLTVSALTSEGLSPFYAEACPSALTSLYVGGSHTIPSKLNSTLGMINKTANLIHQNNVVVPELSGGCQNHFQGTSAAAPLAAGIIALLLEANPWLSWRDVQHLVVHCSSPPMTDERILWDVNGAGHRSNVRYGFGALDAARLIQLGRAWQNVPSQREIFLPCSPFRNRILDVKNLVHFTFWVKPGRLSKIEYAIVTLDAHIRPHRGVLSVSLQSPSGLKSKLLEPRWNEKEGDGIFRNWKLATAQFWDEDPSGPWIISFEIHSHSSKSEDKQRKSFLRSCSLTILGF